MYTKKNSHIVIFYMLVCFFAIACLIWNNQIEKDKLALHNIQGRLIDSNSVQLIWDRVETATGYEIYAKSDSEYLYLGTVTENEAWIDNLKEGIEYTLKIRAYKITETGIRIYGDFTTMVMSVKETTSEEENTLIGKLKYKIPKGGGSCCPPLGDLFF